MRKCLKFFMGSLALVCVIAISIFYKSEKSIKLEEIKKMKVEAIMIGNTFATYENFERNLDINYFYSLNSNTLYSKIEDEIGRPNGEMGSGLVRPYYKVGDQYIVMSFSLNKSGEYDKLSQMSIYTDKEYIGDIPME